MAKRIAHGRVDKVVKDAINEHAELLEQIVLAIGLVPQSGLVEVDAPAEDEKPAAAKPAVKKAAAKPVQ